jgi:hypothetical protein
MVSARVLTQGFEHEVLDLWQPGTLPIQYDGHARFQKIVLKRGIVGGTTPGWDTIVFDPTDHPGIYMDRGLTPGQQYCYQMYGTDSAANDGAPTPVFCATAKNDPEPPLGDLILNAGAQQTDDSMLLATLDLYNKEPSDTEMSMGVDQHPVFAWVPYQYQVPVDPGPGSGPRTVQVYAVLRDSEGGVSDLYTDTIELWPPGSLGGITGTVVVAPSGNPAAGVYVEFTSPEGVNPGATDGSGTFGLDDLSPGSYDLKFSLPGYLPKVLAEVGVQAGQNTEVGVIVLQQPGEVLFVDGFE